MLNRVITHAPLVLQGNVEQYSTEDGHALVSIGYSLERHTISVGILRVVRLRPADYKNKKLLANPFAKM